MATAAKRKAAHALRETRLLQVPPSEIRIGDLVCVVPGTELRRAVRVEASHWPGGDVPTVLVWFPDESGQHFAGDGTVFVVRQECAA